MAETVTKSFYTEVIAALEEYNNRYHPQAIIIASPVFYKEDLYKQISNVALKKKITLANCSSVTEQALNEVIKRPEVREVLQKSRVHKEALLIDELLMEINKNGPVAYGLEEVTRAVNAGAVRILLVSDSFLEKAREEETYQNLDNLMKMVDRQNGEIHIIATDHDAGKQLKHLGGIAALLRFMI
jgi:protein pelota